MSEKSVQKSKSQVIREGFAAGQTIAEISKNNNIKYQMVYNIVSDYCLRNGIEMPKRVTNEDTKAKRIIEMFESGKYTYNEIAREIGTYYNYVSRVISKHLAG